MSNFKKNSIQDNSIAAGQTNAQKNLSNKKQIRARDSLLSKNHIDNDQEIDLPKSMQKQRYQCLEQNPLLANLFQRKYQKVGVQQENYHNLSQKNQFVPLYENASQNSSKRKKKLSETVFSPYDLSFEDRISVQTMDSKQFASSFQFEQKDFFDNQGQFDNKIVDGKRQKISQGGNKNKDYFDNLIIEDDQENEEEKKTQANCEDNSQSHAYPKIEIQINNTDPYSHQQATGFRQNNYQCYGLPQNLDQSSFKYVVQKQKKQREQLSEAYNDAIEENNELSRFVKYLEEKIKKIDEQNKIYVQMMNQVGRNPNTRKFDKSVKIFRKYSF